VILPESAKEYVGKAAGGAESKRDVVERQRTRPVKPRERALKVRRRHGLEIHIKKNVAFETGKGAGAERL